MKFMYNGRLYNPSNVEKKLKSLGITEADITYVNDEPVKAKEKVCLHKFYNPVNKHTIISAVDNLDHLKNVKSYNINDWEYVGIQEYEI